jgi:hypothetical protein
VDTPETLGTPDLRRILRCDRKTVLRWIRLRKVEATKDERGRWRISMSSAALLRKQHGTRRKGYGPFGPRHGGEWYTASERELLRSELPHEEVAARIGRTSLAVEIQRIRMRQGKVHDREIRRRAIADQGGASGAWFISPHAVRRYQDRICVAATAQEALADLIKLSLAARRGRKLNTGCTEYVVGELRCVVAPPARGKRLPVLVTVKPRKAPCVLS